MKQTFTILMVLFLTSPLFAQSETDSENIYLQALAKHISSPKNSDLRRTDSAKETDIYFIEENSIITDEFPSEVNGQKIQVLTRDEIIKKVRTENSFALLSVRPVQWKNGQMEIDVIEFQVFGNKRNLNYINKMSGTSFVIKQASDCQGFELERVKK